MGNAKQRANKKLETPKQTFKFSVYFLVMVVCFVIPLVNFNSTLDPVLFPQLSALGISVFVLAILMFFESRKVRIDAGFFKNGFFITFFLFILVSIASLFIAVNPIEGLTDIIKWVLVFMLFVLAITLMKHSTDFFILLLKGITINALLFFAIGILQYFEYAFNNSDTNALYEVKGMMGHKNQFSIFLFVLLPFLFSGIVILKKRWKKLAIIASALILLLIILILQTRAVWISLFISGLITTTIFLIANYKKGFILLKNVKQKRILYSGLFLIALFTLMTAFFPVGPLKSINERVNTIFNPEFASNEWRVGMWRSTINLVKDQPLSGVGAGNWKISVYPYYSEYLPSVYRHWRSPHNDYLLAFAEKGLPGLIGFSTMFLLLVYFGIRNLFRSNDIKDLLISAFFIFGIIGYMLISFFSFPNERILHLIFITLAAAYIISRYLNHRFTMLSFSVRMGWIVVPILLFSYMAIHFGIISTKSEINIKIAQALQLKKDWKGMSYFANKAQSKFSQIEPENSYPIIMYAGLASFSMGEYQKALKEFKQAYQQHPTSISALNNLGSVYCELGQMDSCIYYHGKTLEIFPHYEFGILNLAKSYYVKKDYETAYQYVLHCNPKSANQEVNQFRFAIERLLIE